MGKKNVIRGAVCGIRVFDASEYGFSLNTHHKYMGSALAFLEKKAPHVFSFIGVRSPEYYKMVLAAFHPKLIKLMESEVEFATSKTSDSWRQIRLSLAHLYSWVGLERFAGDLRKVANPSAESSRAKKPNAKKRMKKIDLADFIRLYDDRLDAGDDDSWSILLILEALGCRPCDIPSIAIKAVDKVGKKVTFRIGSSKNTERGKRDAKYSRGLERDVTVDYDDMLVAAVQRWSGAVRGDDFERRVNSARQRVARAANRIKIRGGKKFCFYTLRYQKGSFLKFKYRNDEDGARKVAAGMGHKCTKSASSYGDTNTGKGLVTLSLHMEPGEAAVEMVIDNRSEYIKKRDQKGASRIADMGVTEVASASGVQHDSAQPVVENEPSGYSPSDVTQRKRHGPSEQYES